MSNPNLPPLPPVPWHQFGGVCANSVAAEAIKDYATSYAEEAVRQALEHAAEICKQRHLLLAEEGFPLEAFASQKLAAAIRALIPEARDG